jgi:hypothetical protein
MATGETDAQEREATMASKEDIERSLEYTREIIQIYSTQATSFEEEAKKTADFVEKKRLNGFAAASRVQADRFRLVERVISELSPRRRSRRRASA